MSIVKVDGTVRMMTADEIAAADTAANNAALAEIHRGDRNRLLAESDFVVTRGAGSWRQRSFSMGDISDCAARLPDHSDWPNLEADDWPTKPSS